MAKDNTLLILGGIGIVGYLVYKSNIAQSIGGVGEGVSEAVQGVGSGISTIGKEAGDIVVDVGSALEPFAAGFNTLASQIDLTNRILSENRLREQSQAQQVDVAAFSQSKDVLASEQAKRETFASGQQTLRSNLTQRAFTSATQIVTAPLLIPSQIPIVLGGVSEAIKGTLTEVIIQQKINDGSIVLPSSVGKNTSVRSTGNTTNMSVQTSAPASSQLKSPTTTAVKPTITQTIGVAVKQTASKALSLLSSISKKLRG